MKTFLLHPTHRKIIKLLRQHIKEGEHLIITQQDVSDYKKLMRRTQISMERHKGVYRLLLNIIRRTNFDEIGVFVNDLEFISLIEKTFARAERKRLDITIRNIIARPILRCFLRWIK